MRVTIVPSDGVVTVDGVTFDGIAMSSLDPTVHAVQWYATWGEVEYADPITKAMLKNEPIADLTAFQAVLQQFSDKKAAADAAAAEAAAQDTVIGV